LFQDNIEKPKTELINNDTLINNDKRIVIELTTNEVFTHYYKMIESLERKYTSISVISYLNIYLKKEKIILEKRIENKSYIHRFAKNENKWLEKDIDEVKQMLRLKTLNRIDEIYEDMEVKSQGPFFLSEDKLEILKKLVMAEINKADNS